ncbi:MAG: dephospho-CoA kinase [Bdellovibrio sp.]|nr:MAG: dephospho-CoA kinase [Bdellovibrio sp.]
MPRKPDERKPEKRKPDERLPDERQPGERQNERQNERQPDKSQPHKSQPDKSLWIGLTGGIASGKSTVARLLFSHGLAVIDADEIAREVVAPGTEGLAAVAQAFGKTILKENGELDRTSLGREVFADEKKREVLENLLHPRIQRRVAELRAKFGAIAPVIIYDVPLLFEKNLASQFDGIVVVICRPEQQVQRLMARTGLSRGEADQRIRSQGPLGDKVKKANWVVDNSGTVEDLERQVEALAKELKTKIPADPKSTPKPKKR